MQDVLDLRRSKVPEVTLAFWVIKIAATTLGETGGDAFSMTMQLSYVISTVVLMAFFVVTAAPQVRARSFHPFLYCTGPSSSRPRLRAPRWPTSRTVLSGSAMLAVP